MRPDLDHKLHFPSLRLFILLPIGDVVKLLYTIIGFVFICDRLQEKDAFRAKLTFVLGALYVAKQCQIF